VGKRHCQWDTQGYDVRSSWGGEYFNLFIHFQTLMACNRHRILQNYLRTQV